MLGWWSSVWAAVDEADRIVGVLPIARRYFAMNAFDGVVTTIGIVTGAMIAGIDRAEVVLGTGLVASVAMGISGFWGAYLTESAERRRSLEAIERHTLTELRDSSVARASRVAVAAVTLVDGLSPFLGAVVVLLPFFTAGWWSDIDTVYYASLGTALAALFLLGAYLGRVSRAGVLGYAVKTMLAGFVAIGAGLLFRLLPVAAH